MNVNKKRIIYILLLLVLVIIIIKTCEIKISRPYRTRSHIARWFVGVPREYVENGYKSGKLKNLCVSNITSLSELIPFREDKVPNNLKITLEDYYKLGFTNQSIYTISSVTPSGKILEFNQNYLEKEKKNYFWLYHYSCKRYELFFVKGPNDYLNDDKISWYYQCLLKDLKSEELEKEKEYRKEKGLPELK